MPRPDPRPPFFPEQAVKLASGLSALDRVWFKEERIRYTVMAASNRFKVCTKPFAAVGTVLYSIIDCERGVRGPDNLVFGFGYETHDQCLRNLEMLEDGDMEVSYRKQIPVAIRKIEVS